MKTELITHKISPKALQLIRMVCAITGEKHSQLLERVLEQELKKQDKIAQK